MCRQINLLFGPFFFLSLSLLYIPYSEVACFKISTLEKEHWMAVIVM
jgi:hypothetical protein